MDNLTMMTDEAIAELERDPAVVNLRLVLEAQFDRWTQVLFPLLQLKKIPCYRFITEMLHKDGHKAATETIVGIYMRRIAKHRNQNSVVRSKPVKAPIGVTPTVTFTRPAREVRPAPVVRVQAAPVAQAVSSLSVEAVPGVEPVEVTDWHAQSRRLGSETRGAEWTGEDEWMWRFFLAKAAPRRLNLFTNAPDVEELLTISQNLCFTPLQAKIRSRK